MRKIDDDRLAELVNWTSDGSQPDMHSALTELQRLRVTMKRINDLDLKLRGNIAIMGGSVLIGPYKIDGGVSRTFLDELRKAIKGEEL